MGNVGSSSSNERRRHGGGRRRHNHAPPLRQPPPEITANLYVFAAATPYPDHYPNPPPPPYYEYRAGVYYPPPPPAATVPFPAAYEHQHGMAAAWRYPTPYVDHQKAVTIRNDVNLKKESLKIEEDELNPGKFLVSFTFDASLDGSITLYFFAKEENDSSLTPTKLHSHPSITVSFEQGLSQKFQQKSGTGIGLSAFGEAELSRKGETDIYPLAVKAEATPGGGNIDSNSQITQVAFDKFKGEYRAKVTKQILWVKGMRYELQEIYGIGNSSDFDGNDSGKECVVCLSEPRDTTVLPCRHMCLCSECANILRFQTNRCPICRQPIERLLEINVKYGAQD